MGEQLTDSRHSDLTINDEVSMDQHPAAVYLAGLSPSSRRTMCGALDTITQPGHSHPLAERYAYTTANRMLSVLHGTLKTAWKLGLMSAEVYQKAASVANISGETVSPVALCRAVSWWYC